MNAKERFYSGLAKETIGKITSNTDNWTSFLRTMSRNYEFTYPEQVMIYAQRPNATFCKPYEDWNAENYRRYVKRGSTGIALFVMNRDKPYLRYVFDVADTGVRRSSPELKPWEVTPENRSYVMEAMERTFGVAADGVLEAQLEDIASALAAEYWDDYKKQFLDIVANSFLEEYDELNIEVAFKNICAWYAEDGIHLAKGSSAIDSPRAQIVSWETVAERIGELLENGRFATNVELVEASGYERQKLAESLWHLYHDLSEEARSSNYLAILHQEPFRGFPDETADLAEKLDDPRFHATLVQQYSEFRKTLAENPDLLRFHYHKLNLIQKQLYELNMPLREYQTDMMQIASASVAVSESPKRVLMSGWIIKCKICQGRRTTRRQTSKHIESSIKCSHDKKHMATFFT